MVKDDKKTEVDFNEALKLIANTPKGLVLDSSLTPKKMTTKTQIASPGVSTSKQKS